MPIFYSVIINCLDPTHVCGVVLFFLCVCMCVFVVVVLFNIKV